MKNHHWSWGLLPALPAIISTWTVAPRMKNPFQRHSFAVEQAAMAVIHSIHSDFTNWVKKKKMDCWWFSVLFKVVNMNGFAEHAQLVAAIVLVLVVGLSFSGLLGWTWNSTMRYWLLKDWPRWDCCLFFVALFLTSSAITAS